MGNLPRFGASGGRVVPKWTQSVTFHPHVLDQLEGRARGSSLGWAAGREACSPFHPASCSCLSLVSLSLTAASLGPWCQPFQAGQFMNLLLLNDRKERNLIGSQQWEGCFWLRAPRPLGPSRNSDSRRARIADRHCTVPLRMTTDRNRKSSRDLSLRYNFLPLGSAS